MGQLVDGEWQSKDLPRNSDNGEFVRKASTFRAWLGDEQFPAESGRYHLFVNAGCPWAYRTILYRSIKGLKGHISLSFTQPAAGPEGWTFGEAESLLGAQHMHHVYTAADSTFTGRCTVPVLWDKQAHTIVNNESADIIRMFNSAFNDLPGVSDADYYPDHLREQIDSLNEVIYNNVNNGVYRCGFAGSQDAYEAAFDALFETLDDLDTHLATHRYLCGDQVTEADWRLFATLARFDLAYHGQFKCNRQMLKDYAYLWPYCRDLYQLPGVAETVDVAAIRGIYYGSRPPRVLPKGPEINFSEPHGRSN